PRQAPGAGVRQQGRGGFERHAAHGARRAGECGRPPARGRLLPLRLAAEGRIARGIRLRGRVQFRPEHRPHPVDRARLRHASRARRRRTQVPVTGRGVGLRWPALLALLATTLVHAQSAGAPTARSADELKAYDLFSKVIAFRTSTGEGKVPALLVYLAD